VDTPTLFALSPLPRLYHHYCNISIAGTAGTAPDVDTLKKCIRKGTLALKFVPVLTGTAFKNKGVQPLLDAVVYYMPAPTDVKDIAVSTTTNAKFAVHVYSTLHAALECSVGSPSTNYELMQWQAVSQRGALQRSQLRMPRCLSTSEQ
jgi:hypothetical protein